MVLTVTCAQNLQQKKKTKVSRFAQPWRMQIRHQAAENLGLRAGVKKPIKQRPAGRGSGARTLNVGTQCSGGSVMNNGFTRLHGDRPAVGSPVLLSPQIHPTLRQLPGQHSLLPLPHELRYKDTDTESRF